MSDAHHVRAQLENSLRAFSSEYGMGVKLHDDHIDFFKSNNIIRISLKHLVYFADIVKSFDYYFSAVLPLKVNNFNFVDYSFPKYHDVTGFDLMPVFFPSFSEPLVTTQQYLDFANIKPGSNVLDLGAYSGLTSIVFKEISGKTGTVVAVEADFSNIESLKKNFSLYEKITNLQIEAVFSAVWNHNDGLSFSSEGNMGSSALSIVGSGRGNSVNVPSTTLSNLIDNVSIETVDFIKCDIEGAEAVIFEDEAFFQRCKPRIIIEPHVVDGTMTTDKCIHDLKKYGYTCKEIHQKGVTIPLLECYPPL